MTTIKDALTQALADMQFMRSTAYHTWDDADYERVNKSIEDFTAALASLEAVELPEPDYIYHYDPNAAEGEDDLYDFKVSGPVDEGCQHCTRLYSESKIRQYIAAALAKQAVPDVDWLAQVIRTVDGNHSLGAGALAEKIVAAIAQVETK